MALDIRAMLVVPNDLEMQDSEEMLDSPRAETPISGMPDSIFDIPDSLPPSPTLDSGNSSPVITSRIFGYADYLGLGTPASTSNDAGSLFDIPESRPTTPLTYPPSLFSIPESRPPTPLAYPNSLFAIPESRPPTPLAYPNSFFDIPASRPSTPMLVDEKTSSSPHQTPAVESTADTPARHNTPPINGRNLIPFLPIITSRAALIRGALLERKSEQVYLRSKIDSVLQDMAELQRQLDTMGALRVIRRAVEQQRAT